MSKLVQNLPPFWDIAAQYPDWQTDETRLIPPVYVKPFVKRQKNDANDAEAIAEVA